MPRKRSKGRAGRMSKRKSSVQHSTDGKRPAKREEYLYLVLDDWEKGYSVHKVDVDASQYCDADEAPEHFTEPPLVRFDVVHGNSHSIVAHGTKIVCMKPHQVSPAIPAFDTATSAVGILPWPEFRMDFGLPLLVSISGKLFLFIDSTYCLSDPPSTTTPCAQQPWVWNTVSSRLPFKVCCVLCWAVHPDKRTLFVSARRWTSDAECGTFSFDAERLEWTRHGNWLMPFDGEAHYVHELDAWVGLCRHKGGTGHLCCSDVVPVVAGRRTTLPRWKMIGRLFHKESPLHIGATLVYMGGTRFCIVESTWHKDDDDVRRKPNCPRSMWATLRLHASCFA